MKTPMARRLAGAGLLAAACLLTACSTTTTAVPPAAPPTQNQPTQPTGGVQAAGDSFGARSAENGYWPKSVQLGLDRALGSIVVDGEGFTLYRFDDDSAQPPRSACTGECVLRWPPVLVNERITFRNIDAGRIGAVTRQDGTQQLTIGGRPAYRYVEDVVPGQTLGQGTGGTWFVLGPDGGKAGTEAPVR